MLYYIPGNVVRTDLLNGSITEQIYNVQHIGLMLQMYGPIAIGKLLTLYVASKNFFCCFEIHEIVNVLIGTPTGCFATSGCWATSYGHCAKEQVIDLLKAGCSESVLDNIRPPIKVSEW